MCGVSHVRIVTMCKTELAGTLVNNMIDMDHPLAREYLAKKMNQKASKSPPDRVSAADQYPGTGGGVETPPGELPAVLTEHGLPPTDYLQGTAIEELGDMTLRELANKYGTVAQLADWLGARKRIVDIAEKEIKNSRLRGELIPRRFVEIHIIQQFERTHMNLLNDAPKSIASELISLIKAGCTLEMAEATVEDALSSHLLACKDHVKRMIKIGEDNDQ